MNKNRYYRQFASCCAGVALLMVGGAAVSDEVGKVLFLVSEDEQLTAVNAETGQFFELGIRAKEVVQKHVVAEGVIIVVTNQRFAGVGIWPTGWSSQRREAGERLLSVEAEDTSAVVVTSDRVLSFNGKTGAWAGKRR